MLENYGALREPRIGVMLHYDGSSSDKGAEHWLMEDEKCRVSYNAMSLDAGRMIFPAPADARAWHAGECQPSSPQLRYRDANSAFYGLSVAAKPGDKITRIQRFTIIEQIWEWFAAQGWPRSDTWRITSHHLEAWPRKGWVKNSKGVLVWQGRKSDILGLENFTLEGVRAAVAGEPGGL